MACEHRDGDTCSLAGDECVDGGERERSCSLRTKGVKKPKAPKEPRTPKEPKAPKTPESEPKTKPKAKPKANKK